MAREMRPSAVPCSVMKTGGAVPVRQQPLMTSRHHKVNRPARWRTGPGCWRLETPGYGCSAGAEGCNSSWPRVVTVARETAPAAAVCPRSIARRGPETSGPSSPPSSLTRPATMLCQNTVGAPLGLLWSTGDTMPDGRLGAPAALVAARRWAKSEAGMRRRSRTGGRAARRGPSLT